MSLADRNVEPAYTCRDNTSAIPFLVPRLLPGPLASRLLGQMVIGVTHVGEICKRSNRVKLTQLVLTAPCTEYNGRHHKD